MLPYTCHIIRQHSLQPFLSFQTSIAKELITSYVDLITNNYTVSLLCKIAFTKAPFSALQFQNISHDNLNKYSKTECKETEKGL